MFIIFENKRIILYTYVIYIIYYWQIGPHNNNYSTEAFCVGRDNCRSIIIHKYRSSTPSSAGGWTSGGTSFCIIPRPQAVVVVLEWVEGGPKAR
jgi:hypothetical protein